MLVKVLVLVVLLVVLPKTGGEVLLGTSYVDGNKTYRYHYFKTPGSFIMPDKGVFDGDLDVLVVAGGGSGGNRSGGGAGGGGVALGENVAFPGTGQLSVPVIVGNGGAVTGASESRGNNGQDSRFGDAPNPYSVVAQGGGYGGGDGNTLVVAVVLLVGDTIMQMVELPLNQVQTLANLG